MTEPIRVLFASAELAPLARVGGLAEAAAGLVAELRDGRDVLDVDIDVVLPDYGDVALENATVTALTVPDWAGGTARVRRGIHPVVGAVTLLATVGTERPHPYTDRDGTGWPDNDVRFFGFAAAVGALVDAERPDVVHLNDWHAAGAVGFIATDVPIVLTIHTLGYQGISDGLWLDRVAQRRSAFEWYDVTNPLVAAIRTADRIIAVSPNYAREITTPEFGAGHDRELAARGADLVGIRNGIDVRQWNPAIDESIPYSYGVGTASRARAANQRVLLERFGLPVTHESADVTTPTIGVVTRLVEQKGIDILLECVPYLPNIGARLVVLGSGEAHLAAGLVAASERFPEWVSFVDGYDAELAHLIFAGSDLLAMPSRFEPCGLAQMQAMAYGTMPVVTAVGGLVDTVTDVDVSPVQGTGIIAREASPTALVDALHRAVRVWRDKGTRARARKNGMTTDWSWARPAAEHVEIYRSLVR